MRFDPIRSLADRWREKDEREEGGGLAGVRFLGRLLMPVVTLSSRSRRKGVRAVPRPSRLPGSQATVRKGKRG